MTDKKRTIAILSITSILIFSGFGYSPFAYSTGNDRDDDWDDWKDWKKWKEQKKHKNNDIESGLCTSPDNLIDNGCFESPDVNNDKDWDIYPLSEPLPDWEAVWVNPDACVGYPPEVQDGQLELQEGILGGPAEGTQHAELDSDCNGPDGPSGGEELTSVIISQETNEDTTADDEYVITFAYKGRPGKNLPLSTNGLSVEWNDADVTPDLKFSKKKWKYASVTVNGIEDENGNPLPSVLKFTDTGTSDTLGTFLDDVSVIKVPKPVVTVILTKEIDNNADPTNPLVKDDPEEFNITLYKNGNMVPNTQIGEDNPNIFQNVDSEGEIFKITEDATNYVPTVVGDGCPNVNDDDPITGEVLLQPGDTLTCHITNTFVPPPVLTLKKALTNDNDGDGKASDFVVKIWDENGPDGGNLIDDVRFDADTSLAEVTGLSPDTGYVLTEEMLRAGDDGMYDTQDDVLDTESYTTVLIAGDTLCPSMENEVFELSIGDKVTCIIYNDDNFVEGSSGGDGIIFHGATVEIKPGGEGGDECGNTSNPVCYTYDENADEYFIVDDQFDSHKFAIVFTVIPAEANPSADAPECEIQNIVVTGSNQGFQFTCNGFVLNNLYNANFALIDTSILS